MIERLEGKLVRDKIPEILEAKGLRLAVRTLDEDEYDERLLDKVSEEFDEFVADRSLEELADLQEVLDTIRERLGFSEEDLKTEQNRKRQEKGGFKQRILLVEVEEDV